jgi:two-component system repressor protein LuxO
MELKLQVKLLRFIQTGMIQRVGSAQAEPVDVRIVCATNRDPLREVAEGRFREDLLYRLNVIPIHLPPLRDRGDDIVLLADRLTESIAQEERRPGLQLSAASRAKIRAHSWPGNVRELQNALRRSVVIGEGDQIEISIPSGPAAMPETLPPPSFKPAFTEPSGTPAPSPVIPHTELAFEGMTLAQIEHLAIEAALKRHGGNVTRAAKELAVNPSTIYRKLEKQRVQSG